MGPKKLWEQLKSEAPRYAKLIPELPRLVHEYLSAPRSAGFNEEVLKLLAESRQTQRTLMRVIWIGLGFVLGLVVMQWVSQMG
jgi:ubiquinone biosynthesis protein